MKIKLYLLFIILFSANAYCETTVFHYEPPNIEFDSKRIIFNNIIEGIQYNNENIKLLSINKSLEQENEILKYLTKVESRISLLESKEKLKGERKMNGYEISGLISIGIFVVGMILFILGSLFQYVWAWIDDGKVTKDDLNIVVKIFQENYYTIKDSNGNYIPQTFYAVTGFVIFGCIPSVLFVMFKFYIITLSIITFFTIAYLARFARRLSKKLKSHVDNDNIHNSETDKV